MARPGPHVRCRIHQRPLDIVHGQHRRRRRRHQLHQAQRPLGRARIAAEPRFDRNDGGQQRPIHAGILCRAGDQPVGGGGRLDR
ncbi:hypothetical protein G6F23_015804 [Rhizopus arrhizus]|nr:hypothetical protein G6F23_015804 [Rhizopus arrhizus]